MGPVPTSSDPMGGKLEIDIDGVVIPSFMLGPISANVAPLLRTSERLSGTTTTPTTQLDNPSYDITFFPNKWSDVGFFMPDNLDGSTFVVGGATCTIPDAVPVTFHYECDGDEDRDINFTARVSFEDNSERNATDDLSVTIHFYPIGAINYGPETTS